MTPRHSPALEASALGAVLALARERATEGITVADLADAAGYSPFHFSRLFSAVLPMSPGQYLTVLRMDAAKRLLLAGTDPVIDVATAVGFDSLSSFARRFRATVGVPPAQMRQLAARLADAPLRPFRLGDPGQPGVRVRMVVPDAVRPSRDVQIWAGWFAQPAPLGVPRGGVLLDAAVDVEIPLCPGYPWLLANVLPAGADPAEQIAPSRLIVAVHPQPIVAPCAVTLRFSPANSTVPILTALPSLWRPE
ncbi:helix-turn-helix transcriptional regulator [Propioniciclava soli]|uniref:Helix-turn-helix transcriptional regulator n=1 Tax=Propioniciclava soli TaxID=2775081 RepID=A0ABZ3C874_9ACTN